MTLKISPHGTKIDVVFTFLKLRLGIKFPCDIIISLASNYENKELEPVQFDPKRMEANIGRIFTICHVFKQIATDPIKIEVQINSNGKKKVAGWISLDVQSLINSGKLAHDHPLEKCPDKTASLSFTFYYDNMRDNPADYRQETRGTRQELSFYSAFANSSDLKSSQAKPKGFNTSMAGQLGGGRDESPNIRLNSRPGKSENKSNVSMGNLGATLGFSSAHKEPEGFNTNLRSSLQPGQPRTSNVNLKLSMTQTAGRQPSSRTPNKRPLGDSTSIENLKLNFGDALPQNTVERISPDVGGQTRNSGIPGQTLIRNLNPQPVRPTPGFSAQNVYANIQRPPTQDNSKPVLTPPPSSFLKADDNTSIRSAPQQPVSRPNRFDGVTSKRGSQHGDHPRGQENCVVTYDTDQRVSNRELIEATAKINELNAESVQKTAEINSISAELAKAKATIEALEKDKAKGEREFQEMRTSFNEKVAQLTEDNEKLKDRLIESNARKADEAKMLELERQVKDFSRNNGQLQEEVESKDIMLSSLKQRLTDLELQNAKLLTDLSNAAKDVEARTANIKNNHTQAMMDKNKEIQRLEGELEGWRTEAERSRKEAEGLQEKVARLEVSVAMVPQGVPVAELEQKKAAIEDLRTQIQALQVEISEKKVKIKSLRDENTNQRAELLQEIQQKDQEIEGLRAQLVHQDAEINQRLRPKLAESEASLASSRYLFEVLEKKMAAKEVQISELRSELERRSIGRSSRQISNELVFVNRKDSGSLEEDSPVRLQSEERERQLAEMEERLASADKLRAEQVSMLRREAEEYLSQNTHLRESLLATEQRKAQAESLAATQASHIDDLSLKLELANKELVRLNDLLAAERSAKIVPVAVR